MRLRRTVRMRSWHVLIVVAILAWPSEAGAQSNVGNGPLTATLADTEPTAGVLSKGPVKIAPGIVVEELGWDSNVFDETVDPKEDYVAAVLPDASIFARTRFLKVSAYAGAELTYYQTYETERSVGYNGRARVDVLLSRMRPFVAGGQTSARTRPNGEIDTRADLKNDELSGGLAFDLSAYSLVYAAAYRSNTQFRDAFEDGVELGLALNRDTFEYSAGMKTDLTPLASLTVFGSYREEKFKHSPARNADSRNLNASLRIGADAAITGAILLGYRDFKPVDPRVRAYQGFTGSIALAYPVLELGRLNLTASRNLEYSFDVTEAYYLENALSLSYTHRLFWSVDAQARGSRAYFNYGFSEGVPAHQDTLDQVLGALGYNLRNRTRVSANYEHARRRSPALAARNYVRRRVFLAWTYAF